MTSYHDEIGGELALVDVTLDEPCVMRQRQTFFIPLQTVSLCADVRREHTDVTVVVDRLLQIIIIAVTSVARV